MTQHFARWVANGYNPSMTKDNETIIIQSPLSQRIEGDGTFIEVQIYHVENQEGWILEVVDEEDAVTVYEDRFETDQAALDEVLETISEGGIFVYLEQDLSDDSDGGYFTIH